MSLQGLQTPQDIIRLALKAVGVAALGQPLNAEDTSDAYAVLQAMLGQWQRRRWLIWHLVDVAFVSTGAQSYAVGPNQNFNVATRPDRLEAAFFRLIQPTGGLAVDYPLEILEAREDYNDIGLKTLDSFPRYIFYDASFPIGNVYPWPIPQASLYEIHLTLKEQLLQFSSIAQQVVLPLEYFEALWSNLAMRLFPLYTRPTDPGVRALAAASMETIRTANAQIPRLTMPPELGRGALYNIYGDTSY